MPDVPSFSAVSRHRAAEIAPWGNRSIEQALHLVDNAPRKLATRQLAHEEKLVALRIIAGLNWDKEGVKQVGSDKLSGITRRAIINPQTKEPGVVLRSRLHAQMVEIRANGGRS